MLSRLLRRVLPGTGDGPCRELRRDSDAGAISMGDSTIWLVRTGADTFRDPLLPSCWYSADCRWLERLLVDRCASILGISVSTLGVALSSSMVGISAGTNVLTSACGGGCNCSCCWGWGCGCTGGCSWVCDCGRASTCDCGRCVWSPSLCMVNLLGFLLSFRLSFLLKLLDSDSAPGKIVSTLTPGDSGSGIVSISGLSATSRCFAHSFVR